MAHADLHVLVAGGGVAALEAALALRAADERLSVELLAPEPHFWYRPAAVAEPFGLGGDILLQWVSKTFLFVLDVLIVVPTLWLFFRFAWLGPMQEADARRKMTQINA